MPTPSPFSRPRREKVADRPDEGTSTSTTRGERPSSALSGTFSHRLRDGRRDGGKSGHISTPAGCLVPRVRNLGTPRGKKMPKPGRGKYWFT